MLKPTVLLIKPFQVILFFTLSITSNYAQEGHYISPYYLFQYTHIINYNDLRNLDINLKDTYHYGYGINYTYNGPTIVGFETGLKYSEQGQDYTGDYDVKDDSTGKTITKNFESELNSSYIQVPFLFKLNSNVRNQGDKDDIVFMSIAFGFQMDFLYRVDMKVTPSPVIDKNNEIDLKELFRKVNTSFVGHTSLNIRVLDHWYLVFGLQLSKTMGDIENKDFDFREPNKDYPFEYFFPTSTKKSGIPIDYYTRDEQSKNLVWGFIAGFSFKI